MEKDSQEHLGKRPLEAVASDLSASQQIQVPQTSSSRREFDFAYGTRENTLYNLTPHSQGRLGIPFVHLNTSDLFSVQDVLAKLPPSLGIREFLGLKHHKVYLSTLSPVQQVTKGINKDDEVSLLARNSFKNFSVKDFLGLAKGLRADVVVGLSEEKVHDPKLPVGKKSDLRAVKKTLNFLDLMLKEYRDESGKSVGEVVAPLVDTEFDDIRQELVESLGKRVESIAGVMAYGTNGLPNKEERLAVLCDRFESIVRDLQPLVARPEMHGKILGSSSSGDPVDVLFKINFGFNFFEATYPFQLAEKGLALDFWPKEWELRFADFQEYNLNLLETLDNGRRRFRRDPELFSRECPLLDLREKRFMQEHEPMFGGTHAEYPLNGYSKAYICHLLNNDEMTGNVLLTLHNCFVYEQFFGVLNRPSFKQNPLGMVYAFCNLVCRKKAF